MAIRIITNKERRPMKNKSLRTPFRSNKKLIRMSIVDPPLVSVSMRDPLGEPGSKVRIFRGLHYIKSRRPSTVKSDTLLSSKSKKRLLPASPRSLIEPPKKIIPSGNCISSTEPQLSQSPAPIPTPGFRVLGSRFYSGEVMSEESADEESQSEYFEEMHAPLEKEEERAYEEQEKKLKQQVLKKKKKRV
eukprot:TRINITY_DN1483_c0_g1_i2.p1 TRINITY_DN1483_c0_g1~~TRINITY_DN1483_c0_g1_i2.p1  ORF type:complete len:189 (-),score=16.93 TRINITY_DN1483_c0_g1_i2:98-664(-)